MEGGTPHCWACAIPEDIWTKFFLLNLVIAFDVASRELVMIHPMLQELDIKRQNKRRAMMGAIVPPAPIPHVWRRKVDEMDGPKWEALCAEIADMLMTYSWWTNQSP